MQSHNTPRIKGALPLMTPRVFPVAPAKTGLAPANLWIASDRAAFKGIV